MQGDSARRTRMILEALAETLEQEGVEPTEETIKEIEEKRAKKKHPDKG